MELLVDALRAQLPHRMRWDISRDPPVVAKRKTDALAPAPGPSPPTLFINATPTRGAKHGSAAWLQNLGETLVLFTVLARLDAVAWRDQLAETWVHLTNYARTVLENKKTPFVLGFNVTMKDVVGLRDWATGVRTPSPAYLDLVARAAVATAEWGHDAVAPQQVVPVRFVLNFRMVEDDRQKRLTQELREILQLVKTMQVHALPAVGDGVGSPGGPVLVVQEVTIDHMYGLMAAEDALDSMKQLVAHGVSMRDLPGTESTDNARLLETLQLLMPSQAPPSCSSSSSFPGVRSLVVSDISSWKAIPAVLSALLHSQSVHRVILEYRQRFEDEMLESFWHWIAYALFSRDATHGVEVLDLQFESLREEDVEMMRELLEADDPLALLMDEARDPEDGDVVVTASRFYWTDPVSADDETDPDFSSTQPVAVRTIKKTDNWWSVLLPGYGKAWVRQADAQLVVPDHDSSSPSPQCPPHLVVSCEHIPTQALVAFFNLVGHQVRIIDLKQLDNYFGDEQEEDWLGAVLAACPHLDELKLGTVEVASLAVFVETLGAPRLRKLAIYSAVDVAQNMAGAHRFFQALADPAQPLAASLEELKLCVQLDEDQCDAFLAMVRGLLARNRRLHSIYLNVEPVDEVEVVEEQIQTGLAKLARANNSVLYTVPLQRQSKAAFVGALARSTAGSRLDSSVVAGIFQFAAQGRKRKFEFNVGP